MGKIINVRKVRHAEALQIDSPEDEKIVRGWLAEQYGEEFAEDAEISNLIQHHAWFLRDVGSPIVYVTSAEEFPQIFEEVDPEDTVESLFTFGS
jgi:hypothetical protein